MIKFYLLAILLVSAVNTQAQVSVDINIGTPPVWAVAAPVEVQYYYLPDIQTYYDVPANRYIYLRNGSWFRSASLPVRYRNYDLYRSRPVYLADYRGNRPYEFYKVHKVKYKGNGNWNKKAYGRSNYNGNRDNGFRKEYKNNNGKGNGNSKGKGKGNGNGKNK